MYLHGGTNFNLPAGTVHLPCTLHAPKFGLGRWLTLYLIGLCPRDVLGERAN
jgi:hypothetical protein